VPFVSFEGIDGSGKSTQLERLAAWLETQGQTVVRTKEPDGGHLGASVRGILIQERQDALKAMEELLLISAARYGHVREVIHPALDAGHWVLCDRFIDSTFALQVYDGGVSEELFHAVTDAVVGETRPDLTIILDVAPRQAAARRDARGGASADPAERTRNFERIRAGFAMLARTDRKRYRLVDADQDEGSVAHSIQEAVRALHLWC
jgi:dTMP kinase